MARRGGAGSSSWGAILPPGRPLLPEPDARIRFWPLPPRRVLLEVLMAPGSPGVWRRGLGAAGASRWIPVTLRSELGFIFAFSHSVSQTFQPRLPTYLSSDSVFPTATFFLFFPPSLSLSPLFLPLLTLSLASPISRAHGARGAAGDGCGHPGLNSPHHN